MKKLKQVRGIFDYLLLKPGEEYEMAPVSEGYVPGMGLGASEDAIRWAYKGHQLERREHLVELDAQIIAKPKQSAKIGWPQKTPELRIDNQRAYVLWLIVRNYSESYRLELTNRRAIKLAREHNFEGKTKACWLYREDASIEQSVSRGKAFWEIDSCWNSQKCEQFHAG